MNSKQLNRLLNLVRETGDRLIVADNESNDVFVLMNLDEYENLSGNGEFGSHDFCHECEYGDHKLEGEQDEFNDDFDPEELNEHAFDFSASGEPRQKRTVDLNERELLEKINGDIADWRGAQVKKDENELAEELVGDVKPESTEKLKIPSGIASIGDVLFDEKYQNREFDNTPRAGIIEEDDLSGVPHEEEKFYLEPVE